MSVILLYRITYPKDGSHSVLADIFFFILLLFLLILVGGMERRENGGPCGKWFWRAKIRGVGIISLGDRDREKERGMEGEKKREKRKEKRSIILCKGERSFWLP